VADEYVVLDPYPFADKRVARDLAIVANRGVLLDLDESPDLRVIPDLAAIEIYEFRKFNVLT